MTTDAERVAAVQAHCGLSDREAEIVLLMMHGRNVPAIAEALVISQNTVRTHVKHIYGKCDVHSRQELISLIVEQGMREIDPATGFHRSRDGVPPA